MKFKSHINSCWTVKCTGYPIAHFSNFNLINCSYYTLKKYEINDQIFCIAEIKITITFQIHIFSLVLFEVIF